MIRLLVVDDEDFELRGLMSMINSLPLPIEVCGTARNGKEGLQKARELRPDAVLSDLRMPQMSGIEMLRALHEEMPELSLMLISGFEDFTAAREGFELGMAAYLLKPISRDDLFRALARMSQGASPTEAPTLPSPPVAPEEERLIRRLLFAPAKRMDALLSQSAIGARFLSRMIYMVASLWIQSTTERDMFDCAPLLSRFSATHDLPAPVVLDGGRAVLLITAPTLISDSVFIDDTTNKVEQLLEALRSQGNDGGIGLSDIGRTPHQLPLLYQQSLTASEQQRSTGISRVVFYDSREAQSTASQVVASIQSILEAEYASSLSLDSIAERLFLSPSHMRRLFKNKTGVTVMDYLENFRLERSLHLLSQPQYKIHEIGSMVGYENPSYFNAVFKRRYGVTPGDYRKAGIRTCDG